MTQRWKITIEYDGTHYLGWQRQKEGKTVQGAIENAIKSFSGEMVTLHVSGRTDAGVHALGQVAHFDLEKTFEPHTVMNAINAYLQGEDIAILKVEAVSSDFNARLSARKRAYFYKILIRKSGRAALDRNRVWCLNYDLNVESMQEASRYLIGKHDFSSFRAVGCQSPSPVKSIDEIRFETEEKQNGDKIITMHIFAKSFLYHQVRNIMGSLKMVGAGEWAPKKIKEILEAQDRTQAGMTAPPQGLYFSYVVYERD